MKIFFSGSESCACKTNSLLLQMECAVLWRKVYLS